MSKAGEQQERLGRVGALKSQLYGIDRFSDQEIAAKELRMRRQVLPHLRERDPLPEIIYCAYCGAPIFKDISLRGFFGYECFSCNWIISIAEREPPWSFD